MQNKIIYIASPYSNPDNDIRIQNYEKVAKYTAELVSKGYIVISPIAYGHVLANFVEMPTDWTFWNKFCCSLLSKCDVMYVLKIDGWDKSIGIKGEIEYAKKNNIPIEYIEG